MHTTRRRFLGAGAAAAAPAVLKAQRSPNDTIRIGVIGAGGRGNYHFMELSRAKAENVAVVAVCDVYRQARESYAARAEKAWGTKVRTTSRYQELLSWPEVDAVIIAAPDFTHSRMLAAAVKAGKDAFCEKPMATNFDDAKTAFLAVKATDRIVQIGTQRRSESQFVGAAKLVQSGVIGKITRVDMQVHFQEPRWRRDHHMIQAADVDWDAFQLGYNMGPFDARKFREWQLFEPTTNGIPGLWMSHFIDLVAWYLDDPYPRGVVANGGVYHWKDGRQTSDVFMALLDYPKDCLVSFAMSLTNSAGARNLWFGTKGPLDVDALKVLPIGSREPDRLMQEIAVERVQVESHVVNWLRCLRTREQPRAPVQAGFSHAVAGIMSSEALRQGRRIGFDAQKLVLT
jgi:predicted dehydrogenase